MKLLKSRVILVIILIMITILLVASNTKSISTFSNSNMRVPVKAGVLLYTDDTFNLLIQKDLEDIQKENPSKIQFTFFNGKADPSVQNEILNTMIQNKYDIIIASVVDRKEQDIIQDFVFKAKQENIPFILYNTTPVNFDTIKDYKKAVIISTDVVQSGILQGKLIADAWNADKETIDKNGDNIMQYIMVKGARESFATDARSRYSIEAINNAGIKTEQLAEVNGNWDKETSKSAIESLFLKYGNKIEVIIANSDDMAIGAIEALQKYGYNISDKSKYIPVFGVDATPEAKDLIKKGIMAGTVIHDHRALAEALYTVGMNLATGEAPLEGTNYKFDETGIRILIPDKEYTAQNQGV